MVEPCLRIGSLLLQGRALLSPLESVSDVGFRHICHKLGAAFTFTEMIRAQGVFLDDSNFKLPTFLLNDRDCKW